MISFNLPFLPPVLASNGGHWGNREVFDLRNFPWMLQTARSLMILALQIHNPFQDRRFDVRMGVLVVVAAQGPEGVVFMTTLKSREKKHSLSRERGIFVETLVCFG